MCKKKNDSANWRPVPPKVEFILNDDLIQTAATPGMVVLDFLRLDQGLKDTKEGCGEGDCGACTVLLGELTNRGVCYRAVASCLLPLGELQGCHLVTGAGLNGEDLSPVQRAIVAAGATQCGFCTPGLVVALTGFILTSESLGELDAVAAVAGNICRCTGYGSIRRALKRLVADLVDFPRDFAGRTAALIGAGYLPSYFRDIAARLGRIVPGQGEEEFSSPTLTVAGGTDLFVQQPGHNRHADLRFLSRESGLQGCRQRGDNLVIGGATTVAAVRVNEILRRVLPRWDRALQMISSPAIRNRATLAGNIVNASPIGDLSIILLALGAELTIAGDGEPRSVPLHSFFRGYKKIDLAAPEIITAITMPVPVPGSHFNFEKVSRRQYLDIASVNTAIYLRMDAGRVTVARISAGGVAPVPLFLAHSSAWLLGKQISGETVAELVRLVAGEIAPISDVRGSADYKRQLLRRLIIAHFVESFPALAAEGLLA